MRVRKPLAVGQNRGAEQSPGLKRTRRLATGTHFFWCIASYDAAFALGDDGAKREVS